MGNLILAIVITFLLQDCFGQTVKVLKDKKRDKKSVEVLLESEIYNTNNNDSEINRLIINSTYDDSVFISTYLKQGVNVTVIQDHKSVVDVKKQNATIDDEIVLLESEAYTLMQNKTIPLNKMIKELEKMYSKIEETKKLKSEERSLRRLTNLSNGLRSQYRRMYETRTDTKLVIMIKILQNVLNATNIEGLNFKEYDGIVAQALRLAQRTYDSGLKQMLRRVVDAYQAFVTPFRNLSNFDSTIRKTKIAFRQKYYNPGNASIIEKRIAELNQLQPSKEQEKNAVNSLKHEAVNLMQTVNLIATAEKVVKSNPENANTTEIENSLKEVENKSENRNFRRIANQLITQIAQKKESPEEVLKEKRNWMKILDAINQTLESPQGFGGNAGLEIIEEKLRNIIKTVKDSDVKIQAKKLIQSVERYRKEIEEILESLEQLDKDGNMPSSDDEVKQFEATVDKIRKLTIRVDDEKVSIKSQQLINKIQKAIQEFRVQKQINNINLALKNMNYSLEKAETSEEIKKDENQLNLLRKALKETYDESKGAQNLINPLFKLVDEMKRKIPSKARKIVLKQDARELLKIVNAYHQDVMPAMKEKIKSLESQFDDLKQIDDEILDTDGLKNRTNAISKEYIRAWQDLNVIRNALKDFGFSPEEYQEVEDFTSTFDMLKKIFQLKRLLKNRQTSEITRKMISIIQNVDHVNNMLEQMERMIKFNMKLLLTSKQTTQQSTERSSTATMTLSTTSIKKVSLTHLVPESKATDLNKTVQKGSAKNSSTINADEDDAE